MYTRSFYKKTLFMTSLAGFLLFSGCNKPDALSGATIWEAPLDEDTIAVDTLSVRAGKLESEIRAAGLVSGVHEAFAVAETSGVVREAGFGIGDRVRSGEALLRVDDTISRLDLERAEAQWEAARIEVEAAEKLSQSGGSSPLSLARARSAESGAKAQYESARKRYEDTVIKAPIDGVIAYRDPAATVGNSINPGVRIARIVDVSSFLLSISVGEREIGLVEKGASVQIFVPAALGEQSISGTIQAIAAASDIGSSSFEVIIAFKDSSGGKIRSGMSASTLIDASSDRDSIIIPSSALIRRGENEAVILEKNGQAEIRQVISSRRLGPRVEILSGLEEGELLVISALSRLRAGSPVQGTVRGDSISWE